ncbi:MULTISPECIES: TolC family protein [unclassified Dysgonomonas]|jgi:cobalt-zinc-cadmium efflux system outer membrane protein|uniref:TolC family protein n=1 Tax=unclassified Dysgonomonas TaxID=2630389 RepID=UPI0025B9C337|nr:MULTISPECIES: TolC family protein [unclassified Dysgonomonas]MDR2002194.1 TolC family protein [Prevotella sp.]HMM03395.1 TolC family protein [Dysgonomonas sp.]
MKKYLYLLLLIFSELSLFAQEDKSIKLTTGEVESLFLSNNLQLVATRFDVDIADAAIAQAKLWDNPNLSISDVNLWSTGSQRDGESEVIPPLFGSFAKNTEFSIELSQLIQTANKRGKLVNREKVSKEIALQEFEEVLRGLKVELRKSVYEIQYSQAYLAILTNQRESLSRLIESHKKQVSQGNIAKNELLRLQSSFLELENEINEVRSDLNEQQKTLKVLLNVDPFTNLEVEENSNPQKSPDSILLARLMELAEESRPDMKLHNLQTQYHEKSLAYEKSLRVPDLTISANYDRYGGVWKDFIGFGVSIDLPFFNRNQGNIRAARISRDQSLYLARQQQNIIQHEVAASYNNYVYTYAFYKKINDDSLLPELDNMLDTYTKNLQNRNISMLEYIDFMDAYRANKQTVLTAKKKVSMQFEELQYTVGTEIR